MLLASVDKDKALALAGVELKDSVFNPLPHTLGQEVQAKLIDLLQRGEIRTIADRVLPFEAHLQG